jgi:hypothetical protein
MRVIEESRGFLSTGLQLYALAPDQFEARHDGGPEGPTGGRF